MNVVFCFCMSSGSSLLFRAENWVKTGPKIAPSEFCRLCRSRTSRDRVIHADASFGVSLCHAGASSTPPRHLCYSNPCGRVSHAAASLRFPLFRAVTRAMWPRHFSLVISSISCVPSIFASFLFNLQFIHAL